MNQSFLKTGLLLIISLFVQKTLISQVKVTTNGKTAIGTLATPPTDVNVELEGDMVYVDGKLYVNPTESIERNTNFYLQVGSTTGYFSGRVQMPAELWVNGYNSSNPYAHISARRINTDDNLGIKLRTFYNGNIKDAMIIKCDGAVGIGRTPTAGKLDVAGDIAINGAIKVSSDIALKENIKEMGTCLEKVSKLKPVSFQYKPYINEADSVDISALIAEGNENKNPVIQGFIAQDVAQVAPELISENINGMLSIDYTSLIPMLVQSIKELKAELDAIKREEEEELKTK